MDMYILHARLCLKYSFQDGFMVLTKWLWRKVVDLYEFTSKVCEVFPLQGHQLRFSNSETHDLPPNPGIKTGNRKILS